ncbi:Transcriptional regulatory protein ZraR [Planctomycetes bacterium Poly30]|uniref:Transcriptional regulatory protein ZraR n=1 Tax=Saltatorellus ferox TaxID=2528018 RepID=A0A518EYI6_9BACT|nr:Transcriptional regulatory protein ZraR [Planctomycetes bacterium Poly30]
MTDPAHVLIIDDDDAHRSMIAELLGDMGVRVSAARNGAEGLAAMEADEPGLILLDMRMPVLDGIGTLEAMRERGHVIPTLVLTAYAEVEDAVHAMKLGALDYLRKPIDISQLQAVVAEHLGTDSSGPLTEHPPLPAGLIAGSAMMQALLADLARVASSQAPLLLQGETGTGKDVLAHLLHRWSRRSAGPFVAVNVAALPDALVESELFGHEKGAFTGATSNRIGQFEAAHEGTLFLDEIGEMPLTLQPKVLRALQDGRISRLGENVERAVDFRLVAATNRDLEARIAEGAFREDLYYRIAVITIEIPPLRERREDILPLARHFLLGIEGGGKHLSPGAETLLLAHDWPGNIRELKSAILRAAVLAPGDTILPDKLPPKIARRKSTGVAEASLSELGLAKLERKAIEDALELHDGNRTEAAKTLGISRRTLLYRLKQYREDDGR